MTRAIDATPSAPTLPPVSSASASWRISALTVSGRSRPSSRRPVGVAHRVGGQRQRERRSAGPGDDRLRRGPRRCAPLRSSSSCDSRSDSGSSSSSTRQRLPAALEPGRARATGGRRSRPRPARGQRRQQLAAQVAAERGHALPGVEDDERPLGLVAPARARLASASATGGMSRPSTKTGVQPRCLGAPGDGTQERALADAAGTVHEHDRSRRLVDPQAVEELELPAPGRRSARCPAVPGGRRALRSREATLPRTGDGGRPCR